MTRSRRRFLAWFGILGIAFAQFAVTAHACALRVGSTPAHTASASAAAHEGHCGGQHAAALPQAPQGNACEVQCTDGAPSGAALDLPPVALVTLAVPLVPATVPAEAREWGRSMLAANSAAPPLALQFCRLLI
jgi:hypothetical protein